MYKNAPVKKLVEPQVFWKGDWSFNYIARTPKDNTKVAISGGKPISGEYEIEINNNTVGHQGANN